MKTNLLYVLIALAIVVSTQAAVCAAGGPQVMFAADEPGAAPNVGTAISSDESRPAGQCSSCGDSYGECGGECCGLSGGCGAFCDGCPKFGIVGMSGFDSFRGISDIDYQDNFGLVSGVNAAMPVPMLAEAGIGMQIGATYGIYDWDGRSSADNVAHDQTQTFVTTGIFHKANNGRRVSFGIVYDWMINQNWGYAATSPVFGQWRGQVEFALDNCNAIGSFGTMRDHSHHQIVRDDGDVLFINARPISQVNFFWHHKFAHGADGRVWFGFPENERLNTTEGGSLGTWIVGADIQVPISPRLALYGNFQYMRPSASAGVQASRESSTDLSLGIAFYPGANSRSRNLNGGCFMPYLPVANNSSFLVDQAVARLN
jgi:hypothetical protein